VKIGSVLALTALVTYETYAQEWISVANNDSLHYRASYALWCDGGFYIFGSHTHSGGFGPTSTIRLGLGRHFPNYQLYGFVEVTDYTFDPPDAPSSYASSGKRRDFAIYASGIAFGFVFAGAGVYYTHQDNIITRYRDAQGTIAHETGRKSHLAFYYLFGLQYQAKLSSHISIPIGLYYRDQENPVGTFPGYQLSSRIGLVYRF
jgi:hypothetical protein